MWKRSRSWTWWACMWGWRRRRRPNKSKVLAFSAVMAKNIAGCGIPFASCQSAGITKSPNSSHTHSSAQMVGPLGGAAGSRRPHFYHGRHSHQSLIFLNNIGTKIIHKKFHCTRGDRGPMSECRGPVGWQQFISHFPWKRPQCQRSVCNMLYIRVCLDGDKGRQKCQQYIKAQ